MHRFSTRLFVTLLFIFPVAVSNATGADRRSAQPPSSKQVEVQLGDDHFLIPTHYFFDQTEPFLPGGFMLSLQLPGLQPFPLGTEYWKLFDEDKELQARVVDLSATEFEPAKRATAVDFYDTVIANATRDFADNPSANIALRVTGEPVYGLTPYYLDIEAYQANHARQFGSTDDMDESFFLDWYLLRDTEGRTITRIMCTAARAKGLRTPRCKQDFIAYGANISLEYAPQHLSHWQELEKGARDLLQGFHSMPKAD